MNEEELKQKSPENLKQGFIPYILLTALITACTLIVLLSYFGLLSFANTVEFSNGRHDPKSVEKLQQVWNAISQDFYQPVDEDKMLEDAAAAIAASVDDVYTTYFSKKEMEAFSERTSGSFQGIGVFVSVEENGRLIIRSMTEDSPAREAGVMVDDEIVSVAGVNVEEIGDEDKIISLIKGEENTKVAIGFFRPHANEVIELEITRRKIKTENILSKIIDNDIGYIQILMFDNEAEDYFEQHLNKLIDSDVKGLIIDLRDNPGGNYEETTKIVDRLIGEGVIVYTEDRNGKREYKNSDAKKIDLPLRVLVNGDSASASEILAGALKDHQAGMLIGTRTFGKGLVQVVQQLRDGSGLKYTRARYFTPNGVCIQGEGIEPDFVVEMPEEYKTWTIADIPMEQDLQLQAALSSFE